MNGFTLNLAGKQWPKTEAPDDDVIRAADSSRPFVSTKVEDAVKNAQFLVAHAAKAGLNIDKKTVAALVEARNALLEERWTAETEIEFWRAYKKITNDVKPVTVESVKALYPSSRTSRFIRLLGDSKASRTVNAFTLLTVVVLISLLVLQIYWVIGNTLITKLSELLQQETALATAIDEEIKTYTEIELRFKINEAGEGSLQSDGIYAFYLSPDWERDTLDTTTKRHALENELEALKRRLDRNSAILLVWNKPWSMFTTPDALASTDYYQSQDQIEDLKEQRLALEQKVAKDPDGQQEIEAKKQQLGELQKQLDLLQAVAKGDDSEQDITQMAQLIEQIDLLNSWVNEPDRADQIINQRQQDIRDLKRQEAALERQLERQKSKEESRRAILTAEFVLIVLQSYFLPLLYGLLGAAAFILRSLGRDIEAVTYSNRSDYHYILRLSLGSLAGLVVGWFIFLLPGQTLLASVSPLALAFLVGYNIEILFSLMDKLIDKLRRPDAATVTKAS